MVSCFDFPCVPSSNHFVGAGCLPLPMFKAETMRVKCSFQVVTVHRGTVLRIFCFWVYQIIQTFSVFSKSIIARLACFVLKFSLFQCSLTMHGNRAVTVIGMMLIVDGVMATWTLVVWLEKASTASTASNHAKPTKSKFAQSLSDVSMCFDVSRLSSDNFMKASLTHLDI